MPLKPARCLAIILVAMACADPGISRADAGGVADDDLLGGAAYKNAFPEGRARDFESAVWQGYVGKTLKIASALPQGVNTIGAHGHTALEIAVYRNDVPMVKALLRAGARPNGTPDRAPLAISLHDGQVKSFKAMAELLVNAGADVDGTYDGSRAIDMACLDGDQAAIEILIGLHTDLDANPGGIEPPIIRVAENGDWSLVQLLLRRGASMWAMDTGGYTLGNLATLHGDPAELAMALGPQYTAGLLSRQTQALHSVVLQLRHAGYPWPAPDANAAAALRASGHWPPLGAGDGKLN